MTHQVRGVDGTELVEVFDGDESVAGPFTPGEAAAWVEAQKAGPRDETKPPEDEPFEPVGIL